MHQPEPSQNPDPRQEPERPPGAESSRGSVPRLQRVQAYGTIVLVVLAGCYTLFVARDYLLPLTLALMLGFLLRPLVRGLRKFGLPRALSAALVLLLLLGTIGTIGYLLFEPALTWMEKAPGSLHQIERKVKQIREPVEQVTEAAEQVDRITDVGDNKGSPQVEISKPSLGQQILSGAGRMIVILAVMVVLLYFLLAIGDLYLDKIVRALPFEVAEERMLALSQAIERQVSTYLLTVTAINVGLGCAVAIAMYLMKMPNPVLWGAMACLLNYVPYLGAMTGVSVVTVVGLLTFDTVGWALLSAAVYFLLTALEGGVITPTILGNRLTLNPLAVFLSLMFWGGLWGIPGAILAVPITATLRILCEHVPALEPAAELLG